MNQYFLLFMYRGYWSLNGFVIVRCAKAERLSVSKRKLRMSLKS